MAEEHTNNFGAKASDKARNEYNDSSELYSQDKTKAWRMFGEKFTFAEILRKLPLKLSECTIMDVACGDGFYSRFLCETGAKKVVGVDISEEMISLARKKSASFSNLQFMCADACTVDITQKHEAFDAVTACYLFNYSPTEDRLHEFGQSIYRHLKPGGYCIGVNSSPFVTEDFIFEEQTMGIRFVFQERPVVDGTPIKITFIEDDGAEFDITNYHLSPETHSRIFKDIGFEEIIWEPIQVAPEGAKKYPIESKLWPSIPVLLFSMRKPYG